MMIIGIYLSWWCSCCCVVGGYEKPCKWLDHGGHPCWFVTSSSIVGEADSMDEEQDERDGSILFVADGFYHKTTSSINDCAGQDMDKLSTWCKNRVDTGSMISVLWGRGWWWWAAQKWQGGSGPGTVPSAQEWFCCTCVSLQSSFHCTVSFTSGGWCFLGGKDTITGRFLQVSFGAGVGVVVSVVVVAAISLMVPMLQWEEWAMSGWNERRGKE